MAEDKEVRLAIGSKLLIEPGLVNAVDLGVVVQPDKQGVVRGERVGEIAFADGAVARHGVGTAEEAIPGGQTVGNVVLMIAAQDIQAQAVGGERRHLVAPKVQLGEQRIGGSGGPGFDEVAGDDEEPGVVIDCGRGDF